MSPLTNKTLVTVILCLCLATAQHAAWAADNGTAFERGVNASQQGDHAAAVEYFNEALRQGRRDGRLYYNLGVSYYKLGRYDEAARAFQHATSDTELEALSYYNLALVAVAQNNNKVAGIWLQRCLGVATDRRLRTLAETLQERISISEESESELVGNAYASVNMGYDDNVLLRDDTLLPSSAIKEDFYLDMFGYATVATRDAKSPRLDVSAYVLKYNDLPHYDLGFMRIGGSLSRTAGTWSLEPGVHAAFFELGGKPLYRTLSFEMNGQHRLDRQTRLKLDYLFERVTESDSTYAYLAGSRQRVRVRMIRSLPQQARVQAEYAVEINNRDDLVSGTTFTSYSPQRQYLRLRGTMPLGASLNGSLSLRYRDSRYRDRNILSDSSVIRRVEHQYDFSAGVSRPWLKNTQLEAEYRYISNQSSIARYDYNRSQIQFGISMSL